MAQGRCWTKKVKQVEFLYVYFPMACLLLINLVFYSITAYKVSSYLLFRVLTVTLHKLLFFQRFSKCKNKHRAYWRAKVIGTRESIWREHGWWHSLIMTTTTMTLTQSFQVLLVYQAIRHYGSELAGQAVAHQKYLTTLFCVFPQ